MAVRAYRAGFVTTDTPGDLLLLSFAGTVTTARYQSLFKNNSNFTVTNGMNFYITRILITATAANGGFRELGYGDTIVNDSVAAPTNAISIIQGIINPTAYTTYVYDVGMQPIPANKAVYFRSSGADSTVTVMGVMF